ncbi:MAG TPA: SRPBCC family protein [Humisphaera sp.]
MPTVEFVTTIDAPLDAVWAFHLDVTAALPVLSPPDAGVRIEEPDLPARVGQRVVMTVRGPLGVRLRWVARLTAFDPPAGAAGDRRARFVDEQERGPFAAFRHEHLFAETDGGARTTLTDRVTYRPPLGPLGWVADKLFLRRQLTDMFRHRHAATRAAMAGKVAASAP